MTEELRSKGIRSIAVGTDVTKKADCKKYVLVICDLHTAICLVCNSCHLNNDHLSACPEFTGMSKLQAAIFALQRLAS